MHRSIYIEREQVNYTEFLNKLCIPVCMLDNLSNELRHILVYLFV